MSDTATTYKLSFTDGSFITLINASADRKIYTIDDRLFVLPNFYVGTYNDDGSTATQIKYDSKGNKYEFKHHGVVINDTIDLTSEDRRVYLGYDMDSDEIVGYFAAPGAESLPQKRSAGSNYLGVMCYDGDTATTGYSSIGEAVKAAEDDYLYYNVTNMLTQSSNIFAHGAYMYMKSWQESDIQGMFFDTSTGKSSHSLDISDELDDFDPISPELPVDPFDPGGNSGGGGGDGDFDDTSDPIDFPPLPTLSAVDTGFVSMYRPSAGDLQQLASFMWSSPLNIWDDVKKIVANPMDCMIGLSIVPVNPSVGAAKAITVGDVPTGVNSYPITNQYVEIQCGSVNVTEYWGAYLDYDPFTKAEIYLPYSGVHPLALDDVMNKTVEVRYHVDVLSGACMAYVKCGESVLYSFAGQCAISVPISGNDWTNAINGTLSIAASIGSMVATGGMSAPQVASKVAGIAATAVNAIKPSVQKSGAVSGGSGLLGIQKPYIILTRPRQAVPGGQNSFMGYPSFITENLSGLSGYTVIDNINLTGVSGTQEERNEIVSLLESGVIF